MAETPETLRWTIDVCRYCGTIARWPGCKHWQSHDGWTVPVVVKPASPAAMGKRLAPTLGTEPPER